LQDEMVDLKEEKKPKNPGPRYQYVGEALGFKEKFLLPKMILDHIADTFPADHYALNIGAHGGWEGKELAKPGKPANEDPANILFARHNWTGLAIEPESELFEKLQENLPMTSVVKAKEYLTPFNVVQILQGYDVPLKFDFLKIDIDSTDCIILNRILQVYRPKYIHMELNFEIPPPVKFSVLYTPDLGNGWFWKKNKMKGFYGCSVSYANDVMSKAGYVLLQTHGLDADFVAKEYAYLFGDIPTDPEILWINGCYAHMKILQIHHFGYRNVVDWVNTPSLEEKVLKIWGNVTDILNLKNITLPFAIL